jgi:hypothetical protein
MPRPILAACLGVLAASVSAGGDLDAKLSSDPVTSAEKAYQSGDRRHIVIPVCGAEPGEVLPGWPLHESPEAWAAMESGQRPILCSDFGEDPNRHKFQRAAKYAERYNRRLLELEGKGLR